VPVDTIKELLASGADVITGNNAGKSELVLAKERMRVEIIESLEQATLRQ
jgi:hypothetical protein